MLKDGSIKGLFESDDREYDFILKETGITYGLTAKSKAAIVADTPEANTPKSKKDNNNNSFDSYVDNYFDFIDTDAIDDVRNDIKICGIGLLCGDTCIDKDKQCDLTANPNQQAKTKELVKAMGGAATVAATKTKETVKEHAPEDVKYNVSNQIGGLLASALPEIPVLSDILAEVSGDVVNELINKVSQKANGGAVSQPLDDADKDRSHGVKELANNLLSIAKEMGKNSIEELKGMSAAEWAGYATQKGIVLAVSSAAGGLTANPLIGYVVGKATKHTAERVGEFVSNSLGKKPNPGTNSDVSMDASANTDPDTDNGSIGSYRLAKGQELKETVEQLIETLKTNILLLIEKNGKQVGIKPPLKLVYYELEGEVSGIVKDKAKQSFYFELTDSKLNIKPMLAA